MSDKIQYCPNCGMNADKYVKQSVDILICTWCQHQLTGRGFQPFDEDETDPLEDLRPSVDAIYDAAGALYGHDDTSPPLAEPWWDYPAIEETLRFVDERIAPRRCDNEAVSACWRCQTVYLADVVRRALSQPYPHVRTSDEGTSYCELAERSSEPAVPDTETLAPEHDSGEKEE